MASHTSLQRGGMKQKIWTLTRTALVIHWFNFHLVQIVFVTSSKMRQFVWGCAITYLRPSVLMMRNTQERKKNPSSENSAFLISTNYEGVFEVEEMKRNITRLYVCISLAFALLFQDWVVLFSYVLTCILYTYILLFLRDSCCWNRD